LHLDLETYSKPGRDWNDGGRCHGGDCYHFVIGVHIDRLIVAPLERRVPRALGAAARSSRWPVGTPALVNSVAGRVLRGLISNNE